MTGRPLIGLAVLLVNTFVTLCHDTGSRHFIDFPGSRLGGRDDDNLVRDDDNLVRDDDNLVRDDDNLVRNDDNLVRDDDNLVRNDTPPSPRA